MLTDEVEVSVARVEELDAGNFFPLSLGSEELRQSGLYGTVASWGARRPFYIRQNGVLSVLCGRLADVREVYMDWERFTVVPPRRPGYELFDMFGGLENVLQMDGEKHTRVRRLMNPAFLGPAIDRLKGDIHRIIEEKLDRIAAIGPAFDAVADYADDLILRVILEASFRLSPQHIAAFKAMQAEMEKLPTYVAGNGLPQCFMDAIGDVRLAIEDIIRVRRATPGDDMISMLITAYEEGDRLTDNELFGQINGIATAGIGTTANTLAGAMMLLSRHPDQRAMIAADPALIDGAIEECLRMNGPGIVSFVRFASRDTEIGGTRIPKDMPVYVSPLATGFDPSAYEDPFRFDIRRKIRTPMVFGTGIHHCIGQRLARYTLRVAILGLMARFPDFRLADPEFRPTYKGLTGELSPISIPMLTH
jgi:cytochrome P450